MHGRAMRCMSRELAAETRLDAPKRGVVASTVGAEDAFVAFGDNSEPSGIMRIDRPFQRRRGMRVDDQPAAGDGLAVDGHVDDTTQRPEVAQSNPVHGAGSGEDVAGFDLADLSLIDRDYLDTEI